MFWATPPLYWVSPLTTPAPAEAPPMVEVDAFEVDWVPIWDVSVGW